MKSLACFLYGSKTVGEAQRLRLPNPAEPGYPCGDASGTSPACLPGLLQAFTHSSSTSPAGAVRFLPCSPCGRSCLRASVGVTATFVKTHKFWSKNVTQNSSSLLLFPGNTTPTRRLWGTEGMKACCRASKLVSSNRASQYKNFSGVVWRWFKVVGNTIKGESSFGIIGNNFFPRAGFENCWIYSCISSQSFWMWLKLAVLRVGLRLNERVFL